MMRSLYVGIFVTGIAAGCAVEVGNGGKKFKDGDKTSGMAPAPGTDPIPGTNPTPGPNPNPNPIPNPIPSLTDGTIQLVFIQEARRGNENLSLFLNSMSLQQDGKSIPLTPSVSSVDLFSASSGSSAVVAEIAVPAGTYSSLTINLNKDKAVSYTDHGNNVFTVRNATNSFALDKEVSIIAKVTTRVEVSLNPYKSIPLITDATKTIDFQPKFASTQPTAKKSYQGTPFLPGTAWVCAYYTSTVTRLNLLEEITTYLPTDDAVVKDDVNCEHAFARAPVVGGVFKFYNLLPGLYFSKTFNSNGDPLPPLPGVIQIEP